MVYFNHRYGCQKCNILGAFDTTVHRISFAQFNATSRTDESFRKRTQAIHHRETSSLEYLRKTDGTPLLDMIKDFPTSDPLHLLEEGVMKRCLRMWMKGSSQNKKKKWSNEIITALNVQILQWNRGFPSDFNRKLRTLQYLSYFKATEFRTILLYIGIVAFKDVLVEQEYTHFLLLCLAIRLYSCRFYVQYQNFEDIAKKFLYGYCDHYINIYGKNEVVSNIHNICHIPDDVEHFGSLNEISTYPFENFLHEIKLRVQPSNTPMEQITRRIIEQSLDRQNNQKINCNKNRNTFWVELKYESKQRNSYPIFKFIKITPNVFLSSKKIGDRWFITKSGDIVAMEYATIKNHEYVIFGKAIADKSDFFTKPYASHKTDIYISNGICIQAKMYNINDIKAKMMCISYNDQTVFIPILHSIDECLEYIVQIDATK